MTIALIKCASIRDNGYHHVKGNCSHQVSLHLGTTAPIKSKVMRSFLWKGNSKVAWEVVCLPKQEGGLGIRRLESFNTALIAAHIWRLFNSMDSLWVKWIHTYRLRGRNFWDVYVEVICLGVGGRFFILGLLLGNFFGIILGMV